jgi:SNF2 family DNA or RNA helicase
MVKKYFYPVKTLPNKISVLPKSPMIDLQNQDYRSLISIILRDNGVDLSNSSKKRAFIDSAYFDNEVFKNTEFDFIPNHKKYTITAKNPVLVLRLTTPITQNEKTWKSVKLKYTGVRYSGMNLGTSYLGNTIGIPNNKEKKILIPDIEYEKEIRNYFWKNTKDVYYSYKCKNLLEVMSKYKCNVFYKGVGDPKYFYFFDIKEYISDDFYRSEFEKIISKYKLHKDKEYIVLNDYFVKTKDIEKYLSEIMNILIGKDLELFKKHQDKARKISKSEYLPNLDKLLKNFKLIPFEAQKIGISWTYQLYKSNLPGCILADDVGVGKTAQAIGLATILKNENLLNKREYGNIVVVCPASVISVWEKEIQKINPGLIKVTEIYSFERFQNINLAKKPTLLIIDEAQKAKNKDTLNNKSLSAVKAKFTLLLSGTPIENRVKEIYNILSIVDPVFSKIYNTLARVSKDETTIAKETRRIIDGIYLRRLKSKEQLPAKLNIEEVYIPMSKQETKIHEEILNFYGNKKIKSNAKTNLEFYNEYIIALGRLMQCTSYSKQLEDLDFLKKKISTFDRTSSKGNKLLHLVKSKREEKFIIFSRYSKTIEYLKTILSPLSKEKVLVIDGSVPSSKRGEIIEKFQTDPEVKYIIVSFKAGNSGITLHSSNNIVIYDLWWNPAILHQAIARSYRTGQLKDVNAYLFINEKSIDENIIRILNLKKDIQNSFDSNVKDNSNDKKIVNKLIEDIF